MRLLHVMASAPEGGAEMTMLDSVKALAQSGSIQQYVVTRPNNAWRLEQFSEAGIAYATTNLNPQFRQLSRYKLARVIERFRPDIIQYWKARAGRFTYPRYRARSLAWHGGTAHLNRLSGCDWHQGTSPEVVAELLHQGVAEDRAFAVPPFASSTEGDSLSRAQFGVPAAAPLAVVLSRLHAKKGLHTLLEAAKSVPELHVLIAGDGVMRGALAAQIKALGLRDRVQLLGWRNDRAALMELADFIICPSKIEPFGKIVIEGWAYGKPVIAADAIGPSTLITPGKTGLLVRRGDDEALAAALQQLIASPQMAEELGAAGRDAYISEYGERVFTKQMMTIYEKILETAGPF